MIVAAGKYNNTQTVRNCEELSDGIVNIIILRREIVLYREGSRSFSPSGARFCVELFKVGK
jgi:hypothetical protein